jgi:hypothetical protein
VDCEASDNAGVRTEEAVAPTPDLNPTGVGRVAAESSGWGVGEGLQRLAGRERRGGEGGGGV